MSGKILITGFEPFGGDRENPAEEVVKRLEGEPVSGRIVVGVSLPVVFGEAIRQLEEALDRHQPELVICLGLAANRQAISLERVALNVDDASIPDNAGQQPIDRPIRADGPAAYWSTLPIKAMRARMNEAGFATEISQTAGTYVCNHVFYGLMDALAARSEVRGGFVHIPRAEGAFPLATLVAAVRMGVETALSRTVDVPESGGAIA